jgi:hypothetical protein
LGRNNRDGAVNLARRQNIVCCNSAVDHKLEMGVEKRTLSMPSESEKKKFLIAVQSFCCLLIVKFGLARLS